MGKEKKTAESTVFHSISRLGATGTDLIYRPNSLTPRSLPKNKKRVDYIFENAFPTFSDYTRSFWREGHEWASVKYICLEQKKDVSRKIKTSGLVKDDGELIKIGKKEKVLEVQISICGCIICNTGKM